MNEYTSYKLRLKSAVLQEARRCFLQYGIRIVKMDDIARNLGVSKRTVYELYATKEELLCEVIRALHEERNKSVQELFATCDNNMDLLIGVLGLQLKSAAAVNFAFFKDIQKYPQAEKLINEYYKQQNVYAAEFFAKGVEEGFFLPTVDYTVLNRVASGTMEMLSKDERFDDLSYRELFLGYLYVMVRGFCTVKGIEKMDKFVEKNF
ncbi:MAG: TetR/AcrR family transcriptional regulator [Prevotellaceae bacterium]|nr:TetR/AcrR family transcriptional regulator [Prevotellaceae bacterium]MDO4931625.1 TetR/AcrR family transcriptional regulator [Prevotellaceae bacterium]